jgi:hypothetical protein
MLETRRPIQAVDRYGAGSRQTYFLQPGRHNAGAEGVDANIQLGHKMPGRNPIATQQTGKNASTRLT